MSTQADWRLEGRYFETCNCETACPCIWLADPSEGQCKLLVAWHIETGHYQTVGLDNLNVALACFAPGNMIKGGWQAALYLDQRASPAQTQALQTIFSGQAGGHLAMLMQLVEGVWGIRQVEIDYHDDDRTPRLRIPGIAEAAIESIQGIAGGDSRIENPPLCV
ncbi:MAG: DUF1326 domain-containing protein, partial [Methylococcales bacterium]|nr:DUF1326 domain-containing protein [Methylococcales bacterium]